MYSTMLMTLVTEHRFCRPFTHDLPPVLVNLMSPYTSVSHLLAYRLSRRHPNLPDRQALGHSAAIPGSLLLTREAYGALYANLRRTVPFRVRRLLGRGWDELIVQNKHENVCNAGTQMLKDASPGRVIYRAIDGECALRRSPRVHDHESCSG
jgi:hypothetical protein